jgi:maleate isomerase
MLTPSSNTVLEPLTSQMLQGIDDVTAHYSRLRVLKISLESDSLDQFDVEPMLNAANLLADAEVSSICWNGTSSGWLGFDKDAQLCAAISEHTKIPTCTSVLALNEVLECTNAKRVAFVTPYLDDIQNAIVSNYTGAGYEIVAERHLGDKGNYSFCQYSETDILELCRAVAVEQPDAISIFCTNFRGAAVAAIIESETGIPVYDSVSTGLWKSMKLAGKDPSVIKGWGSLFNVA